VLVVCPSPSSPVVQPCHEDSHSVTALAAHRRTFPPEPSSAREARQLLHGLLARTDRLRWADAAELALSELATNAVLHAHTSFEVSVRVGEDGLCVQVRDDSCLLPEQRSYEQVATTGRGLALVSLLTDQCGVHSLGEQGKVVWFTITDAAPGHDALTVWEVDEGLDPPSTPSDEVPVVLGKLPVTLWLAARQHHDALLRELVYQQADSHRPEVDLVAVDAAHNLLGAEMDRALAHTGWVEPGPASVVSGYPSALPSVPQDVTVELTFPATTGAAFSALQDALDGAERLAVQGRLLVHPGLPEVVAVRDWVCEQVVAQLAGVPAAPWAGTSQEGFEAAAQPGPGVGQGWDGALVRDSAEGVAAADQANRIIAVSRPLAQLLGWEVDELLGRRVVTLVPPHLREAHVAGFTRHLTTGQAHLLGKQVQVPVQHADGSTVLCEFRLEQAQVDGRAVYLAWISAAGAGRH
jgi:PAS domain S-box-containing protein